MKLRCYNATIKSKTWYPLKDTPGGNTVLLLTSVLNWELAETLQARGLCYDDNRVARIFEGNIGLPVQLTGAVVELGERRFESSLIHKLKVGRKEKASESDITLHLQLRLHFGGDQQIHLDEFCREVGAGEFSFIIDPAQGAFDFDEKHAAEAVEPDGQEPVEEHLKGPALASHREMAGGTTSAARAAKKAKQAELEPVN